MLSIALSLYFSTLPQYSLDQRLNFILWHFYIKHWTTAQVYNIELFLAKISDLGNVCNKTSMSLSTYIDHCTVKGPKYIADIFLYHPLKRTTKRDDTFLQFMLRYQTYMDKTFVKHAEILVKYYLLQTCREYCVSEFCKYTSKTGNFSYIKLKRFATGVTSFWVCYPLPSFI